MIRFALSLAVCLVLGACATNPQVSTASEIRAFAHVPDAPPSLTLYTIVNNRNGRGAHTALMVTGTEQVIFDPAGSFRHEEVLRSGDVLHGITPAFVQGYESMHARETHHVVAQKVAVPPEVAQQALALVMRNGPVAAAHCAQSTSAILRQLPGFQGVRQTFYPVQLQQSFAAVTGVQGRRYYEDFTPPGQGVSRAAVAPVTAAGGR